MRAHKSQKHTALTTKQTSVTDKSFATTNDSFSSYQTFSIANASLSETTKSILSVDTSNKTSITLST